MATYYLPSSGGYPTDNEFVIYRIKFVEGVYDPSTRTIPVTVSAQFWRTNTGYTTHMNGTCYCEINGTEYSQDVSYSNSAHAITYNSYTELFSKTITVTYSNDGNASITAKAKIKLTSSSTTPLSSNYQGGTQALTKQAAQTYTLKINPNGGYRVSDNVTDVISITKNFGETEDISEIRKDGYTLTGYNIINTASGSTTDIGGAKITFNNSTKTAVFTQGSKDVTVIAQWKNNANQDIYICYDTGKVYAKSYIVSESIYIDSSGNIYAPAFTVGSHFSIGSDGITATEFIEGIP